MKEQLGTHSRNRFETRDSDNGNLLELALITIFFIFVFSTIARAETSSSVEASLATTSTTKTESPWGFNGKLVLETTRTLLESDPISYGGSYDAIFGVSHKPSGVGGSLRLIFAQEYSYERDDGTDHSFENPAAAIAKKWTFGNEIEPAFIDAVAISLKGSVPGNRESRRRTFLGSTGVGVSVEKKFARASIMEDLSYGRQFYEYDIRDDGTVNSPDSYRSVTALELAMTERFSLSAALFYTYAVSFQGVGRATQLSSLSADYAFSKNVAASLGIATERGTLDPDGQSNQIKFFEEDTSQAFFDLVLSI